MAANDPKKRLQQFLMTFKNVMDKFTFVRRNSFFYAVSSVYKNKYKYFIQE